VWKTNRRQGLVEKKKKAMRAMMMKSMKGLTTWKMVPCG